MVSFVIAFVLGILLGVFKKIFYVPVNKKIAKIVGVLPGANCGACGYPGCDAFAAAVAAGEAPVSGCSAGGPDVTTQIATVLGINAESQKMVALRTCQGSKTKAQDKGMYLGVQTCSAAKTIGIYGTKLCSYGCMGFGDCVDVCSFDSLHIGEDGLPIVNYNTCTGCGMCVTACPQDIMILVPQERKGAITLCVNRNPVKRVLLKQCKTACIKCGKCERVCEYDAIHLINGIPIVNYEKCTSCDDCIKACPTKALSLVEQIVKT
ncbi:MAG TPA: RnfABCDGE type electron transport complex subunit B [Treponemataceae bacterium]|nr:RnfABCDGE type electron transport complex subunit B [Treponemataceae bacterium]